MKRRRIEGLAIEGWSPEYGAPVEAGIEELASAQVDVGPELPEGEWRPLGAGEDTRVPGRVDFVDGVRRIEARVWITGEDGEARLGICASFAAGVVRCEQRAEIVSAKVGRGFFGLAGVPDLKTRAGTFPACPVAEDDMQQLVNGLQERMGRLEIEVAGFGGEPGSGPGPSGSRPESSGPGPSGNGDSLIVLDGPLRGRQRIPSAIGYVKSHRVQYLPAGPREVVARLAPRQRTPVFLIQQTKWTRFSWYLRLTEAAGHPWAGIVRCEAWPERGLDKVIKIAGATAAALPRFASEPHKDDRAPQNLYPIAGLERDLRHRLGDPGVVYRALQRAVADYRPPAGGA